MPKRGRKPRSKRSAPAFDITKLSKGYLRKLNALRKSLGNAIADSAFAQWLREQPEHAATADPQAAKIVRALEPMALKGQLKLPKSGYVVRRGRGRLIVEARSK